MRAPKDCVIPALSTAKLHTGISLQLEEVINVCASLSGGDASEQLVKGLAVEPSVVFDNSESYGFLGLRNVELHITGELCVCVNNRNSTSVRIKAGDVIAILVLHSMLCPNLHVEKEAPVHSTESFEKTTAGGLQRQHGVVE